MRPFFSFSCNFNRISFGISIEQAIKHDLVGYGYDIAPTLVSLKINILFLNLEAGNLFINK